jgi:alpha-mannosidase
LDERIIRTKLDLLYRRAILHTWPITPWQVRTARYAAVGEYRYDGDWTLVSGDSSWPAGCTLLLRTQAKTPADASLQDLYLQFDIQDLEGLLSVNGRPYAGIDANHRRVKLPIVGTLNLEAEFMSVPSSYFDPTAAQGRLHAASFVQMDPEALAAWYDLNFAWEASRQVQEGRRQQLLAAALEDALLLLDMTAPQETFAGQVAAARELLAARIGAIAPDPEGGRVFLTGHSHIDTAWLWPLRETVRKVGRTFSTACRMMERYPDYRFSCTQPQLYAYARRHFPQVYEDVRRWVQAGRWECTAGMWVEADCNATSGESLIRQILYGVRFFQQEFGKRPRSCWLPDTFGFPASMPQILKGSGIDYFMTCKLHWQARDPVQNSLFWWEGLDGSRVLAHVPHLQHYYNGSPTPEQLTIAWRDYLQKAAYPEVLLPFGYGDGGGGPTEEMLEYAQRAQGFPGLPATRQGGGEEYFAAAEKAQPDLPTWEGELYLETHRGTLTTQGAIKRANRKNELLLRDAEILGSLARLAGGEVDLAPLASAWENLLLLQFHDILPGSSIGEVYREAAQDHARIARDAGAVRDAAVQSLLQSTGAGGDVVALNTLSWPRNDVASAVIPMPQGPVELLRPDGQATPVQVTAQTPDYAEIVFAPGVVPPLGYSAFRLRPADKPVVHSLYVTPRLLVSRFFRLELNDDGEITRLTDKRNCRELVPEGERANVLQLFQDGPEREAAWNVHATFEKAEYAWGPGTQIEVLESGPVRATLRVTRRYRGSRLEQDIIVYDQVPRIDFVTRVDWQERQVMLKAAFPVEVRSPRATYEVQFGAVERATHRNTSWEQEKFEVCGQRWADLSEPGYGISLLNDCKYGYDVHGHTLRLTLLRGPEWPDPDADRGTHEFVYALWPHEGDWTSGGTVQRAAELNTPLLCLPGAVPGAGAVLGSLLEVAGPALLQTLKPAEDGQGWIARLYEPHGGRGTVRVRMPRPLASVLACNLVEEPVNGLGNGLNGLAERQAKVTVESEGFSFAIRPFEIRTFRLQFA